METSISQTKKWAAIRDFYERMTPEILARPRDVYWIDPYKIDWHKFFTPIESEAWQTIRGVGIPLYPQFPIGNIFVDFGDPVKKIVLECDGKDFHDKESDIIRDTTLHKLGWIVFRVTGRECIQPGIDLEPLVVDLHNENIYQDKFDLKVSNWALNSSDGVISAIAWWYYNKSRSKHIEKHLFNSLKNHSVFFDGGEN